MITAPKATLLSVAVPGAFLTRWTGYQRGQDMVARNENQRFYGLTTDIINKARLICWIRLARTSHPIWREELEPTLPDRHRKPLRELRESQKALRDARWHHDLALRGKYVLEMPMGRREPKAAKKTLERAIRREKQAGAAANATQLARGRAQNILIERLLKGLGDDLRSLHAEFAPAFEVRKMELARLYHPDGYEVGAWKGTSACDVVKQIAETLLGLHDHAHDVSPELWTALGNALPGEVGKLSGTPATGQASRRKPSRRKAGGTKRGYDLDIKACAAANSLEEEGVDWMPKDIAERLKLGKSGYQSLMGTKPGPGGVERIDRCPKWKDRWLKNQARKKAASRRPGAG